MFLPIFVPLLNWPPMFSSWKELLADSHGVHEKVLQVRLARRGAYGDIASVEEIDRIFQLGSAIRIVLGHAPALAEFALLPPTPYLVLPFVEGLSSRLLQLEYGARRKLHLSAAVWERRYRSRLETLLGERLDLYIKVFRYHLLEPDEQVDLRDAVLTALRKRPCSTLH